MSAQIGVLAAIDAAIEGIHGEGYECPYLEDAYGAVAELIEAIGPALYELRDKSEAKKDLIAALARVKGA